MSSSAKAPGVEPTPVAPSGGAVLRSPALPLAALEPIFAAPDVAGLDEALASLLRLPLVAEAIMLASPNLHAQLHDWCEEERGAPARSTAAAKARDAMRASLLAYVVRMATRCTPFGGFAGCVALPTSGGPTRVAVAGASASRSHTRLDLELLARLVRGAAADRTRRAGLRFVASPNVYRAGGKLRLAEADDDGGVLRYRRVAVGDDPAVQTALSVAANPGTPGEIASRLVAAFAAEAAADDPAPTMDEVVDYLDDLIDAQLLVPVAEPAVTGDEPARSVAEALAANGATAGIGAALGEAVGLLQEFDAAAPGRDVSVLREVWARLDALGAKPQASTLFQSDLVLGSDATANVGADLVGRIAGAVEVLHRITPWPVDGDLGRLATALEERYEGAWVPLLEALDEEVGVGFARSQSADGQPLIPWPLQTPPIAGPARPEDAVLVELAVRALTAGAAAGVEVAELVLADDDIDRIAAVMGSPPPLPDAFAAACLLEQSDPSTSLPRLVIQAVYGPSGARLLGRFCHADPMVHDIVKANIAAEEAADPEAVFAEVVHLPEGRIGNVLCRPILRAHELVHLGRSGLGDDRAHALALDDLLVSGQRGRVRLWSRSLDRAVRPRMATAHNWRTSRLAAYRFLCAMQADGVAEGLAWRWGIAGSLPTLPRVALADGTVLSRATWRLSAPEVEALTSDDDVRRAAVVAERRLPDRLALAEGDNELVIELSSVAGRILLDRQARRGGTRSGVVAIEAVRGDGAVRSPDGRRAGELVVPLVRTDRPAPDPTARPTVARPRRAGAAPSPVPWHGHADEPDRRFGPGSPWLSIRLGCGQGTADAVLVDVVGPLVRAAEARGLLDGWFFLRYADPDHHLRVRLRGAGTSRAERSASVGAVLPAIDAALASWLDDGRLTTARIDTYRREVDRYGGAEGVDLFEAFSIVDSALCAAVIAGGGDLTARWRLTVLGVHGILRAFDDPALAVAEQAAEARRRLASWRDGLAAEHGALGPQLVQRAGAVHRTDGRTLLALVDGAGATAAERDALAPMATRNRALDHVAGRYRALAATGDLGVDLDDIIGALCHLHCNRMLRAAQRAQELVVYDLVDRTLRSTAARAQGRGRPPA